jgi:predicted nucleotidyltransferase
MIEVENRTSLEKIPEELRLLVDEVVEVYKLVFGESLTAVYLAGSIPRGQFRAGKSDADFYAVIDEQRNLDLKKVFKEKLNELNKKWVQKGVTSIDGDVLYFNELKNDKNLRTAFILQTDAVCVYGKPIDLSFAVPESALDLATLMNKLAKIRLRKIENRLIEGTSQKKDIRRITKLTLRCAFGIALIEGALYTPEYSQYQIEIDKYVPELSENIKRLLALSNNSIPTQEMINIAKSAIDIAEKRGIKFL